MSWEENVRSSYQLIEMYVKPEWAGVAREAFEAEFGWRVLAGEERVNADWEAFTEVMRRVRNEGWRT